MPRNWDFFDDFEVVVFSECVKNDELWGTVLSGFCVLWPHKDCFWKRTGSVTGVFLQVGQEIEMAFTCLFWLKHLDFFLNKHFCICGFIWWFVFTFILFYVFFFFLLENLFQYSFSSSSSGRCQECGQKAPKWRCGWQWVDAER